MISPRFVDISDPLKRRHQVDSAGNDAWPENGIRDKKVLRRDLFKRCAEDPNCFYNSVRVVSGWSNENIDVAGSAWIAVSSQRKRTYHQVISASF